MSTTADNQDRVTRAIADYMRRVDAGETVDRDKFIETHSEVADELKRYLDNVALVERMAGPTPAEQSQSPGKEAARRETVSASQGGDSVPEKKATVTEGLLSGMFGRYKIEKTLGEGAMGTVYLATDTQLHRRVALKVPKFKDDDTEMMERFYREARSAAKLRHRHICPVHDIGEIDGIKYISIAFIDGHPLSAYVSPDKPQTERNIAIIIRKLALALQVAHHEGVIHRDLKPANVMVDKKTEPVIMDFGLAREINKQEDNRLTQTGTIMGSPAYMSPEQVNADNEKIGPCSDIYSLGVMLYELLTGNLPFEGSIAAVIGQILMKEPDKPSTFRPDLDPRLEAICEKMMAKEIDERYASMKDVADTLTDFLKNPTKSGEKRSVGKLESFAPVELKEVAKKSKKRRTVAREKTRPEPADTFATRGQASGGRQPADTSIPQSAFDRLKNLPRRTKAIAGGLAGLVLLLGITIIIKVGDRTVTATTDKDRLEVEANGVTVKATSNSVGPVVPAEPATRAINEAAGTAGPTRLTDEQAAAIRAGDLPKYDTAGEEYQRPEVLVRTGIFDANVDPVRYSPDGRSLLGIQWGDFRLASFDPLTGKKLLETDVGWGNKEDGGFATALAISPTETLAAGGSAKGKLLLWDYTTGKLKHEIKDHTGGVQEAAFTPDGKQLLVSSTRDGILVWDVDTGKRVAAYTKTEGIPNNNANSLAVSPDGSVFAAGGTQQLNLYDLQTGEIRWSKRKTKVHHFNEAAFSRDGKLLAAYVRSKTSQNRIAVYKVADGTVVTELGSPPQSMEQAEELRFLDSDSRLLVSHKGGPTRIWDIATGRLLQEIDGAESADVLPDGKSIVTKGPGTAVRLWQFDDQKLQLALAGPTITADNATYETLRSGAWQEFYANAEDLPQDDSITFRDGQITLDNRKLRISGLRPRNVAVRARIKKESGRGFSIHVRSKVKSDRDDGTLVVPNDGFETDYAFWTHGPRSTAGINRIKVGLGGRRELLKANLDVTNDEFELLVAAIDDRLLYFVDGKLVMETRDSSASDAGEIVLGSYSSKFTMSNVAVRVLDSASESNAQADDWVDLIPNIDTKRDTISGKWETSEGTLKLGSGGKINLLRLPAKPDSSYEVECAFTRHVVSGDERGISLVLPAGGRQVGALFCSYGKNRLSGLASIDGASALDESSPCRSTAFRIEPEKRHVISVRVTVSDNVADIQASADGKPLFSWKGDVDLLSMKFTDDEIDPDGQILLGCPTSDKTTFHKLRWRRLGAGLTVEDGDPVTKPARKNEATFTRLARLEGTAVSPYAPFALAISHDGSLLLDSITTDGYLRARKVATGEIVKFPFQSPKNVTAAAYSADGETLLIGTSESKVYVQPLKPGRRAIELATVHPVVRKVAYDTAGRVLVFSNGTSRRSEGAVERFIVSTRKEVGIVRFKQNQGYCPCLVSFTADGSRVAIVNDNRAILYDLDKNKKLPVQFEPHIKLPSVAYGWASGVALSPGNKQLMTWGYDMRIRVTDTESGKRILPPLLHLAQVKPPDLPSHLHPSRGLFSRDGRWFVNSYTSGVSGAALPGEIVLRDATTGEDLASEIIPNAPPTGKSKYNESYVTRLVLSDDGRFLAAAGSAMKIHVWRIDQQNLPPAEALARTISIDFRRKPFEEAMQEMGKLAGVEMRVDGDALRAARYSTNLKLTLDMTDKSLRDVLEAIVNKYSRMAYMVENDHILLTSKDAAEHGQLVKGNWTPAFTDPAQVKQARNAKVLPGGLIVFEVEGPQSKWSVIPDESVRAADMAIRAKVRKFKGDNIAFWVRVGARSHYAIHSDSDSFVSATKMVAGKRTGLQSVIDGGGRTHPGSDRLPIDIEPQEWNEWLVAVRGNRVTAWVNGKRVIEFTNDEVTGSGGVAIFHDESHVQFKDLEVQVLSSAKDDDSGNWTPVLNKAADFQGVPHAKLLPNGIIEMGEDRRRSYTLVSVKDPDGESLKAADIAIRAKVKVVKGKYFYFMVRWDGESRSNYNVTTDGKSEIAGFQKINGKNENVTGIRPIRVDDGDWVEWMVVARDDTITAYADGREVFKFTDNQLKSGSIAIGTDNSKTLFKEVEVQILKAAPAAAQRPARQQPVGRGAATQVEVLEIEALVKANREQGKFGRPPQLTRIKSFVNAELSRRKNAGQIPKNANITFIYDRQGNIIGRRIFFGVGAGRGRLGGGRTGGGGGGFGGGSATKKN